MRLFHVQFHFLLACFFLSGTFSMDVPTLKGVPDGYTLIQGDLLVPIEHVQNGKWQPLVFQRDYPWPNLGQGIPYDISQAGFTEAFKSRIRFAFSHISNYTCLTFSEVTYPNVPTAYLKFQQTDVGACYSNVGYAPNRINIINLDPEGCAPIGTIVHEICHSLGLLHTQIRPDRDQFIMVDMSVIAPAKRYNFNFSTLPAVNVNPYDYDSTMQYGETSFTTNGSISIYAPQAIGQHYGLSVSDVAELLFMYGNCTNESVMCLHTVPRDASVGVGAVFPMSFVVNTGNGDSSVVSYTLPPSTTASLSSGNSMARFQSIEFNITGSASALFQPINITVQFAVGSRTAVCSASVVVKPYTDPLNCYGILASLNTSVCSGHGQCVFPDICNCTVGYAGRECEVQSSAFADEALSQGWKTPFDSIPLTTLLSAPANWTFPSIDYVEDYVLDIDPVGADYFDLKRIRLPVTVQSTSTVTISFHDFQQNGFGEMPCSLSALALGSTAVRAIKTTGWITRIPRRGQLRITTTVPAYWLNGNASVAVGSEDSTFGSISGKRLYFGLSGVVYCKDGYYGPKCQYACVGRSALTVGAAQCNWRGLCHDGPNGDGKCTCLGAELSAGCHHVPTTCADFASANCPTGLTTSATNTTCANSACTAATCCVPVVMCASFNASLCPVGKVLASDVSKICATAICTTTDCCEAPDPCLAFTNCSSCAAQAACGWCASKRLCVSGTIDGPPFLSCSKWQYDTDMCTSSCGTGVISITGRVGVNSFINGLYRKVAKPSSGPNNGRAYYFSAASGKYLFYASNNNWIIGDDITSTGGFAYNTESAALEPHLIASTSWKVWNNTAWETVPAVVAACAAPACQSTDASVCTPLGKIPSTSITKVCSASTCTAGECCVPVPARCSDFDPSLCPANQVASISTDLCPNATCTTAICCAPIAKCGAFSASLCPSGQALVADATKTCALKDCTASECCESADPCAAFSNCTDCASQPACGWCASKGICMSGTANGPPVLSCSRWQYDTFMCTANCTSGVITIAGRVGLYAFINSNYRRSFKSPLSNGKPFYNGTNGYLLFSTSTYLWFVGTNPSTSSGYANFQQNVMEPHLGTTTWKVYNSTAWVLDPNVTATCAPPACQSFDASVCSALGKIVTTSQTKVCATATCTAADCCVTPPSRCSDFESGLCTGNLTSTKSTDTCPNYVCTASVCCQPPPSNCMLAVPLPTGYLASGATCTGLKTAAECASGLTCATGFTGTVRLNCSAEGQNFTLSGCRPTCALVAAADCASGSQLVARPAEVLCQSVSSCVTSCCVAIVTNTDNVCGLPSPIPIGYKYTGTCTTGIYSITRCGAVTCDPAFGGQVGYTCPSNNSKYILSGCYLPICKLPSPLDAGYTVTACPGFQTSTACKLACVAGFTAATPKATCATNGSDFILSGCNPNNCSMPAATAIPKGYLYDNTSCVGPMGVSQCSGLTCASGYDGTPGLACAINKGTFTLSGCTENVCSLPTLGPEYTPPAAGKCVGLMKAGGCVLTCNKGYTGTPKLFCAANATEFTVTGCRLNLCTLPLASAMVGYQFDATCPGNQTVMDCAASVSCAPGYHGLANLTCAADKGKFVLGGCSDNLCSLPNPLPPSYLLPSTGKCLGPVKASSCTGLKCARGFSGTPIDFCPVDGGIFNVSGCYPNNCTRGNVAGYFYSGSSCDGLMNAADCAGHSCGPGFHGRPMVECPDNNKNLSLSGCTPNQCRLPNPLPAPYTIASGKCVGYTTAADLSVKTTRKTDCLDVKCNTGFYGTPVLSCPADGQFFQLDGCVETFCKMPATMPVGFTTSADFATDCPTTDLGTTDGPFYTAPDLLNCTGVVCAPGYNGPPVIPVCSAKNTTFAFYGCSPNQCELPDPMPANYQSSGECYGLQPVSTCKGVTCAVGVTPTSPSVVLSCPTDLGVFVLNGCD